MGNACKTPTNSQGADMDLRPKDTLHYYDAYGQGEAIRMALHFAHNDDEEENAWKDKRYSS